MKHFDRVDARAKLKPRRDPYWQRLSRGCYVGFRRMTKDSSGSWLARFYDGEKYVQRPLGDFGRLDEKARFDAAKRDAEAWFQHMDHGGSAKPGTVRSACEAYVEHLGTENSVAASKDANGRFTRLVYSDQIARIDLGKLSAHHVSAWRTRLLKAGDPDDASFRASVNRNLTALRAALNLAKAQGKVATDQAWSTWLRPLDGAGKRRERYLPLAKRRALVKEANDEASPLFKAMALVPMRPGELAALKVEHLDVGQKCLRIPTGKTEARTLPLSSEALMHFKTCAKDKLPSAWLLSRANGAQWKKEAWRDEIKVAAGAAKLPRDVVAYSIRHSVITDLVVGGLDIFTVAKLAGTSVAMIEKHYGHLQAATARKALEKLTLA